MQTAFNLQEGKMCQLLLTTLLSFILSTARKQMEWLCFGIYFPFAQTWPIEFWPTADRYYRPGIRPSNIGFLMEMLTAA